MMALEEIRHDTEAALFHAPYKADGCGVRQADNHPQIRPYFLCVGTASEAASESIASALNAVPRLLAAVEAVLELHKPDAETGKCEECTYARFSTSSVSWPCPTTRAITSALDAKS